MSSQDKNKQTNKPNSLYLRTRVSIPLHITLIIIIIYNNYKSTKFIQLLRSNLQIASIPLGT